MQTRNRGGRGAWATIAAAALVGLVGCGGGGGGDEVVVDGSSTVFRISRQAQIDFDKVDPSIRVDVGSHGTSGGFDRYFQGEVDIIDASRDAKPEETKKAAELGYTWTRFLVGYDGITVVANPKNDFVKELSVEQLKRLFAPDSTVTSWKELDPSWPDTKILLYAPDTDSGTFEFFAEAIVGKGTKTQRKDVTQSPNDNQLVAGVAGDAGALGYFGYAYYASNTDKLRSVPIKAAADAPAVAPSPATVIDKSYKPLSRPLYIFVKTEALKRPAVAKFVRHYLDNVERLATEGGYVAPNEGDRAANAEALKNALGGTSEASS